MHYYSVIMTDLMPMPEIIAADVDDENKMQALAEEYYDYVDRSIRLNMEDNGHEEEILTITEWLESSKHIRAHFVFPEARISVVRIRD